MLQKMFNLNPEEVDLPGFPLFSLFTIGIGMTSCIPDMNPSKPSQCDPEKLIQNITDNQATFVAGSPAIWERVADYCLKHKKSLPSVKFLVMFGAPSPLLFTKSLKIFFPMEQPLRRMERQSRSRSANSPVKKSSTKRLPSREKEMEHV